MSARNSPPPRLETRQSTQAKCFAPEIAAQAAVGTRREGSQDLARALSTPAFYEAAFRERVQRYYPGATLFALYFSPDSTVVEPSGAFFASGEALISTPTRLRSGKKAQASLSVPVRVNGDFSWDLWFTATEVAPIESHYPSGLAQGLSARSPRPRPPAAA